MKYAEAVTAFDKATRADAANAEAWGGMAFAASKAAQPQLTLHALTERSRLAEETPATLYQRATAYDTLRNKEQAAAYYHHFLEVAKGRFPDQEWQARQRLLVVEKQAH